MVNLNWWTQIVYRCYFELVLLGHRYGRGVRGILQVKYPDPLLLLGFPLLVGNRREGETCHLFQFR